MPLEDDVRYMFPHLVHLRGRVYLNLNRQRQPQPQTSFDVLRLEGNDTDSLSFSPRALGGAIHTHRIHRIHHNRNHQRQ